MKIRPDLLSIGIVFTLIVSPKSVSLGQGATPLVPKEPSKQEAALITRLAEVIRLGPIVSLHDRPVPDLTQAALKPLGINYAIISAKLVRRRVSLNETDMSLRAFLTALAGADGNYAVIGNCICLGTVRDVRSVFAKEMILPEEPSKDDRALLTSLEKARITIYLQGAGWFDHFEMMARQAGCNIVVDERVADVAHVAPLRFKDVALGTALRLRCGADLNYGITDGIVYVSTDHRVSKMVAARPMLPPKPAAEDVALLSKLYKKHIDVLFENQTPLVDAVKYLQNKIESNFVVDKKVLEHHLVDLTFNDVSVGAVLRMLCGPELNYGVRNGVIYVSTEDGLAKMMGE